MGKLEFMFGFKLYAIIINVVCFVTYMYGCFLYVYYLYS